MRTYKNITVVHPDGDEQQELEDLIEAISTQTRYTSQQVQAFLAIRDATTQANEDVHEFMASHAWVEVLLNQSPAEIAAAVTQADAQELRRILSIVLLVVRHYVRQQVEAREELIPLEEVMN